MNITGYLLEAGIIQEDRQEIVDFGLNQMKLQLINWISTLMIGILFQKVLTSIFFLLFFTVLRSYAGGFHAKTVKRCYVISLILVFCSIWSLQLGFWTSKLCMISTIISSLILFFIVPIDNENRRLDIVEKRRFRKITFVILSIEIVVEILGILFGYRVLYEAIALGISMTTVLAIFGVYKNIKCITSTSTN